MDTYRRLLIVAMTVLMTAGGLILTAPARAQQAGQPGGRYQVLITRLTRQGEVDEDFGRDVAEAVREQIDALPTHAPVDEDELDDALDQFDLDEEDLDCITGRQLAVQIQVQLVMCGEYQQTPQGVQVAARFVGSETGEAFEVEPFTAAEPEQAAQQIFTAFERYVNQLRFATFCLEDLQSQSWQSALDRCNNALAINPNSQEALLGKGRALMELDSLEQSLTALQKVLELNPAKTDALLTAGIVATRLGQEEVARGYFRQYLELNPGSVEVRIQVATDVNDAGDPEGALQIVEEGFAQAPDNISLIQYAGHFALQAAQGYESESQGADGEEQPSPRADSLYDVALGYYGRVFDQQGAQAQPSMLSNMISALVKLDRAQEAVELGRRVVAAKPDNANLWSNYATALQRAGQIDEALAALDSVIARQPDRPAVHARRGDWLLEAGRLDAAVAAFEQAITRGEATADQVGHNIFVTGYTQKFDMDAATYPNEFPADYMREELDAALDYFALAREIADSEQTDAMASFWSGYILYNRAMRLQEPETVASAQEALPLFQEALQFFQQSGPYAETQSSFELADFINGANQYIEIQQLLIERGS